LVVDSVARERPGSGHRQSRDDGDGDPRVGHKPKGASSLRSWKHERSATDSPMEQSPEVGGGLRPVPGPPVRGWPGCARQPPDDEREEVAVTRHGCRRGESFEGRLRLGEIESQAGRSPVRLFGGGGCSGRSGSSKETRRTPRSAAGCNKPARYRAEKTVGAGRNGKGGTSPERGNSGPKVAAREESSFGTKRHDRSPSLLFGALGRRTVTRRGRSMLMSTEGRSLDNPKRGIPIRP
jgi:hypothetical protein